MPQIPTPPVSRPGSENPEAELKPAEASSELLASLDTLLEQYLHLLDRQQKLQSGFSKQLSSGFLALAHANYTCPPGRRYGRDYYDERMKTNKKISIQTEQDVDEAEDTPDSLEEAETPASNDLLYNFHIQSISNREAEKTDEKEDAEKLPVEDKQTEAPSQQEEIPTKQTSDTTSSAAENSSAVVDTDNAVEEPKKPHKKFRSDDPIYWYGILVPPSLRSAQKSFTEGVRTQVPALAGTIVEMRALEHKITQLRAKLESST
ncbi:uncharacterized protein N7498_007403 [Penicillium cinerascens]|uniref:Vacuolar ATPase assembly protein VMA22 n=1 Tax=Penicillium cinerascens TaxID=70096 RepID=A0A9W9JQA9_9EURO|nr:uncharacterized protein N7498_007403 [Penicillium cinerascens]KAJ5198286.1 hypothetical protein N7498_007403 [Penicillium cinerascens]